MLTDFGYHNGYKVLIAHDGTFEAWALGEDDQPTERVMEAKSFESLKSRLDEVVRTLAKIDKKPVLIASYDGDFERGVITSSRENERSYGGPYEFRVKFIRDKWGKSWAYHSIEDLIKDNDANLEVQKTIRENKTAIKKLEDANDKLIKKMERYTLRELRPKEASE